MVCPPCRATQVTARVLTPWQLLQADQGLTSQAVGGDVGGMGGVPAPGLPCAVASQVGAATTRSKTSVVRYKVRYKGRYLC